MSFPLPNYRGTSVTIRRPIPSVHQRCNLPSTYLNTNPTAFPLFLAPDLICLLLCDTHQSPSLTCHSRTLPASLRPRPSSRNLLTLAVVFGLRSRKAAAFPSLIIPSQRSFKAASCSPLSNHNHEG